MQLNESTYETFFLLYVDNELSPRERLEIEAFIADNPSFALEMEALKATVLNAENVPYAFKENLKQQLDQTSLEALGEDWDANYATILKKEVQAIPGLSTSFKKSLKKTTVSEGILIKSFGFYQHKFTYAAIAACLMVFIGYQQLTKSQLSDSQISSSSATNSMVSNSLATNSNKVLIPNVSSASTASAKSEVTVISKSNKQELVNNIKPITKTKKEILNLKNLNTSELEIAKTNRNVSIAIVEPTSNNSILNNQAIITKLPSSYNNPITIDAMVENTTDEKATTSYELIDTEDPNRTISIANFEIDGAAFRGITRRISALLKRNKLEKEK